MHFRAPEAPHRTYKLPCGQCTGCRLERSRQWALRCIHEAQMHTYNSFITLTYDDEHLPENGTLRHRDFQLFMKRLRKTLLPGRKAALQSPSGTLLSNGEIRFYMAGEYGDKLGRPHYHAAIFGLDFADKQYLRTTGAGFKLYRSPTLEKIWTLGHSSIGAVTFESAAYIARYIMKKITGDLAEKHYEKINEHGEIIKIKPEYNCMSRAKGIGSQWLDEYAADAYPQGKITLRGGLASNTPRFYDKRYKKTNPTEYEQLKFDRTLNAALNWKENTPRRKRAKTAVQDAQLSMLKRGDL